MFPTIPTSHGRRPVETMAVAEECTDVERQPPRRRLRTGETAADFQRCVIVLMDTSTYLQKLHQASSQEDNKGMADLEPVHPELGRVRDLVPQLEQLSPGDASRLG